MLVVSKRGFTAKNLAEAGFVEYDTTAQSISVYPWAKMHDDLQSVDEFPASKHPRNITLIDVAFITSQKVV